jgi:kinesin family protein 6/9
MSVSFMEIYNENAYDLLENKHIELPFEQWSKVQNSVRQVSFYEDDEGSVQTKNLTVHSVTDEQQGIDLLMMGNFIKKVSATSLNQSSSRSHCVFTILVEGRCLEDGVEFSAKLHLVDLAGSERISKTNV